MVCQQAFILLGYRGKLALYVNVAFNIRERIIEARVRCFLIRGFRLKYLVDAIGQ